MSCAYRHAAARIATIAGIPPDLMLTAVDIARQRRVTFPDLPPDRLRTIAPLLGITPTCGNPQQVIARAQSALIALGTLHSTHPSVERWMAIAAALLGVPEDHLPVPVHPDVLATVRAQWVAPPPDPAPDRATAGIAALWRGDPIPAELVTDALRTGDRTAIVTWMAYGVWDDRFEAICRRLTDAEIGTIARAGVVPDALVERIAQRWQSDDLPWDVFPLDMWDRVTDAKIARAGRARTAAAKLVRDPTLRDDRLIAAAAEAPWSARDVLVARTDLRDERLIDAVAEDENEMYACSVLFQRHDLRDERLIATVARSARAAARVLCGTDLCDERLIAAVAEDPQYARAVLVARPDLRTETRLIEAAADPDWWAYDVLIKHPDRYTDEQLIAVAAQQPSSARVVLIMRRDLRDDRLIDAVIKGMPWSARDVLIMRRDLRDDRLIDAVVTKGTPSDARDVLLARHDLSDDRLIAAVAVRPWDARDVLIERHDLSDDRLIAAVAEDPWCAHEVLIARCDLRDDRLITAVATKGRPLDVYRVLLARPDLRTDARLLAAIARDRALADNVLTHYPDLRDHLLLAVARNTTGSSR